MPHRVMALQARAEEVVSASFVHHTVRSATGVCAGQVAFTTASLALAASGDASTACLLLVRQPYHITSHHHDQSATSENISPSKFLRIVWRCTARILQLAFDSRV